MTLALIDFFFKPTEQMFTNICSSKLFPGLVSIKGDSSFYVSLVYIIVYCSMKCKEFQGAALQSLASFG